MAEGEPVNAAGVLADYHISQPSSDGAEEHHYLTLEPAEAVAVLSEAAGGARYTVIDNQTGALLAGVALQPASAPWPGESAITTRPVLGEATDDA